MSYIVIEVFDVGDKRFRHALFTSEDDRCEIFIEDETPLLIFTADCVVKEPSGVVLGRFHYGEHDITFKALDGTEFAKNCGETVLSIPHGLETIFKLEREVFKVWLKR